MGNIVLDFLCTDNAEVIEEFIAIETFRENYPF